MLFSRYHTVFLNDLLRNPRFFPLAALLHHKNHFRHFSLCDKPVSHVGDFSLMNPHTFALPPKALHNKNRIPLFCMLLISCRCIHITQAVSAIFFLPVPFHMKHAMRHIRQLRITELRFRNLKIIACKTALSVISGIPCRNFRMNRLHAVDDKMYLMIAGRKSSYFSSPYSWLLLR